MSTRDPRHDYKRNWWRTRRAYLAMLRAMANPAPEPVEAVPEPVRDPLAEARAAVAPLAAWNRMTRQRGGATWAMSQHP